MLEISLFRGSYAFLSNFYASPVVLYRITYPTVENAFQAAKTLDVTQRTQFVNCTPAEAKRLGRRVKLRESWFEIRIHFMKLLLEQKFAPGTDLALKLKATGNATLIEGNTWHDNFWGKCSCETCQNKRQQHNNLGKLLMEIRSSLDCSK